MEQRSNQWAGQQTVHVNAFTFWSRRLKINAIGMDLGMDSEICMVFLWSRFWGYILTADGALL